MSWFLYVLECVDGSLYTGISNDVPARYAAHLAGKGAKYTRGRPPRRLLAVVDCADRASASRAEYEVKRLSLPRKREFCRLHEPAPALAYACHGHEHETLASGNSATTPAPSGDSAGLSWRSAPP